MEMRTLGTTEIAISPILIRKLGLQPRASSTTLHQFLVFLNWSMTHPRRFIRQPNERSPDTSGGAAKSVDREKRMGQW